MDKDYNKQALQAFFDKTAIHLLTQNARSVDESIEQTPPNKFSACRYRSPNGLMCAMGVHMTDEEYPPTME